MSDLTNQAVDAAESVSHSETTAGPDRLSKRFIVALVLLYFGAYIPAVGMATVAWPVITAQLAPEDKVLWLSIVTGVYALVNVIGTPIAGTLSDRCTWRFGMRRPFIILGVALSATGLLIMGFSSSIQVLLLGVVIQGLGNATITGAAGALIPDQVPEQHRGRMQGVIMVCIVSSGVIASIFLPLFLSNQVLLFGGPAVFMVVAAILVNIVLKDRRLTTAERAEQRKKSSSFLSEFKIDPRTIPDYSWAWISKLVVILGTVLTSTFGVYVLTDQLAVPPDDLPGIITATGLVGLATAIVGAIGGSWLSDKLRKRKSMVLTTTAFIAAGALVVAFSPNVSVYMVGLVLMGLGSGAYSPIDGALFIDVLPGEGRESGKYMSLMTVADQIPRSFGPILGSAVVAMAGIVAIGGYSLLYIIGAVVALIGGLLVRKIKGSI